MLRHYARYALHILTTKENHARPPLLPQLSTGIDKHKYLNECIKEAQLAVALAAGVPSGHVPSMTKIVFIYLRAYLIKSLTLAAIV